MTSSGFAIAEEQAPLLQRMLVVRGPAAARWTLHGVRIADTHVRAIFRRLPADPAREDDAEVYAELQLHHPSTPIPGAHERTRQFSVVPITPLDDPELPALVTAIASSTRLHEGGWRWRTRSESGGAPIRVPLPAAIMRTWPLGLRPAAIKLLPRWIELVYPGGLSLRVRAPADAELELALAPDARGAAVPRAQAARLLAAIRRRLREDGRAAAWLRELRARASSLPDAALLAALEPGARPTREHVERVISISSDPWIPAWLELAAGRPDAALALRERAQDQAQDSPQDPPQVPPQDPPQDDVPPWPRFCAALAAALAGDPVRARALATALADSPQLIDPSQRGACGDLLLALREPETAVTPLAFAHRLTGAGAPLLRAAAVASGARDLAAPLLAQAARALVDELLRDDRPPDPAAAAQLDALIGEHLEVDAAEQALALLRELRSLGGPARALATPPLADLLLYGGRLDEAAALAQETIRAHLGLEETLETGLEAAQISRARRVLAAVATLRGDHEDALVHSERALASAQPDPQAHLWRAEALLDAAATPRDDDEHGDRALALLEQARAAAQRAPLSSHPAVHLLEGVAELRTGALLDDNRFIFPAVVAAALEREQDELGPPTIELGRRALRALGGNRSAPLTRVTRPPATPRRWAYQTPRRAFEDLQLNLFHEPPDAVLARFADARRERPELPYPYTYGAELLLWLGRYEEAAALLEEAWRRFKTRWAYVGAGAAQGLLGRPGRALDWWKRGAAQFQGMLDAEATYAYRGELYLVHDKPERARQELRFALRHRPSRVASWAALALSGLRVHDRDEAARALAELTRRAPALIWEARRARGLPPQTTLSLNTCSEKHVCSTLEAALELARGNRSSKLLTFVDARGRLRVCGDDHATRWRALAGRARSVARDALIEQALARPPATPGPR